MAESNSAAAKEIELRVANEQNLAEKHAEENDDDDKDINMDNKDKMEWHGDEEDYESNPTKEN